jgi:hypothetical protein
LKKTLGFNMSKILFKMQLGTMASNHRYKRFVGFTAFGIDFGFWIDDEPKRDYAKEYIAALREASEEIIQKEIESKCLHLQ